MHELIYLTLKAIQIMFLNIVLSFDNISVIAIITNNLPVKYVKRAYVGGITITLLFTIFFTSIISLIMEIQWLPIQLAGGILLLKMTFHMLRADTSKKETGQNPSSLEEKPNLKFHTAIIKITVIGLSLSFDNILAIAGAADGNIEVITYGLIMSLPIILYLCRYILDLIKKKRIILYISGAILIYTALEMIFSYQLIAPYIPKIISVTTPVIFSMAVFFYGVYIVKKIPGKPVYECKSEDK